MINVRNNLPKGEKPEKDASGPISAKPIPVLESNEAAALIVVNISIFSKDNMTHVLRNVIMYRSMNTVMFETVSADIGLPDIFTA